MTSKLFHSLVGVGMALGAGSACSATVDHAEPAAATAEPLTQPEAFCDRPWPTTKGNPAPLVCTQPSPECAKAGRPQLCFEAETPGACDWSKGHAAVCVGGRWQCPSGTTPRDACQP